MMVHTFIHVAVCFGIVAACVCRLNNEVCRLYLRARLRVVFMLGGALASLTQPLLFGSHATISETLLGSALLASLVLNAARWWRSYIPKEQA